MRYARSFFALAVVFSFSNTATTAEPLELRPNDHICIIGNTLAERMQHDGWLETLLHARFPKHNLVIRNLGYSGDELTVRLRSMDFGTPDQWLSGKAPIPQPHKLKSTDGIPANRFERTGTQADVIFAFFGYNESFAGDAGLAKFEADFEAFLKHIWNQNYNGKTGPRMAMFSPIAHEDLKNPHMPDGKANNERLAKYTAAMAKICAKFDVPFVNLFEISRDLYGKAKQPLTINGVHLNESGNEQVARGIDAALFGKASPRETQAVEAIRKAVVEKNRFWFNRYRVTDGYSTYGERAFLKFAPDQQSNYEVGQRELEVLDVMTANRDKRIWAVASGTTLSRQDPAVDDSNTPPFIPVITNKPGPLPGGKHVYLDGEEAIKSMKLAPNIKVNLFASEKQFPDLVNPVQMTWDAKGRLWVAVWPTYPHWKPKESMNDKLLILEDTNGDGRADKCTVFADGLHNPTGFEFVPGGVLVAQVPDLLLLKSTKNDDKCDVRERVLHGLDSADTHHSANSFAVDPGGAVYFQEGTFHHTQVETPWGPPVRCVNAGVYRFEPRTGKFSAYVSHGFANPHGHVFDKWGRDIVVDGTGSQPYDAALFSGHIEHPDKHPSPPQVYQQWTRPCAGIEILSSRHFPESMQGNLLVSNVITYQGILSYKLREDGASIVGTEAERLLSSSDPNFRPSDIKMGPDGAIYFSDWNNPIIGHMQHNLRDPSRGREHGRVYRVTYEGRPLLKDPPIAGQPIDKLLELLKWPEDRVRYRVRQELANRPKQEILSGLDRFLKASKENTTVAWTVEDKEAIQHEVLEVMWVMQSQNAEELSTFLPIILRSQDHRVRAAAIRALSYSIYRFPPGIVSASGSSSRTTGVPTLSPALSALFKCAADEHPRVRLEAVRAASFFTEPEAFEVCLIAAEKPTDKYLDFVQRETRRTLEPIVRKALAAGKPDLFTTEAGHRWYVKNVPVATLATLARNRTIALELLTRSGVSDELRRSAAGDLAKFDNTNEAKALLAALQLLGDEPRTDTSTVYDLVRLLTFRADSELAAIRTDLENLALKSKSPVARQFGFVALIAADKGVDRAWALAQTAFTPLRDLLEAVPLIRDAETRSSLFPKIEPLLTTLPPAIAAWKTNEVRGRYVRIELPGERRTLTLAEVEVWSLGLNRARIGRATQKNTSNSGEANRAIDGNTSGKYNDNGQTHTRENTSDPWWEVDLGSESPISRIRIFNRSDGELGRRLNGFTLKVLDDSRRVVFEQTKLPAPRESQTIELGGEAPEHFIRTAAMYALTTMPGREADAFRAIAKLVASTDNRVAAVQMLRRIPASAWPAGETKAVLDALIAWVRSTPAAERTRVEVLDALQLADALANTLPRDQARIARRTLAEIGVRVLRVGTKYEQMLFDQDQLVVQAGKPIEIIFENSDQMPHNFAIVEPGSLEEIGAMAETTATDPKAAERSFIPDSRKVLLGSKLIQPRETQKLTFTAPMKPGVYPYVCTYPGHWRRMYGAMFVVPDLEEYLADAEGYLARTGIAAVDPLLKSNRPRKEWSLTELAVELPALNKGRSHAAGKKLFESANCAACHKLSGVGYEIGADLAKLDPKTTNHDILESVLDPSAKIDDKYRSWRLELTSGKVVTGLIIEESSDTVKLVENPLASAKPLVVRKSDIGAREKVASSIMPKGLLDKLTKEEILDLLAYVAARGDQKNAVYHDSHKHGH